MGSSAQGVTAADVDPLSSLAYRDQPMVHDALIDLAGLLAPDLPAFTTTLIDISRRQISGYEELDDRLIELLRASIDENVVAIVHLLEHGLEPENVVAPPSAIAYARRLAQRDVPLAALVRNYRIGLSVFLQLAFALITDPEGAVQRKLAGSMSNVKGGSATLIEATTSTMLATHATASIYIDEVTEQVTSAYEAERDRWVRRQGALVGHRVSAIINQSVRPEAAQDGLIYDLSDVHLAIIAWESGDGDVTGGVNADNLLHRCSRSVGSTTPGLVTAADEREHWLWLPVPGNADPDSIYRRLTEAAEDFEIMMAVGAPSRGLDGFRLSHQQAQQVRRVMSTAGDVGSDRHLATFAELGPIALLGDDLPTLRSWVGATLGPLASSGKREAALRETLLTFLEAQGSFVAAAERLHLHRNTVAYRVEQAETLRGRPTTEDRLQVQLALATCRWFGEHVLG